MKVNKANVVLILKETLICIALVVVALGLNYFLFKDCVIDDIDIAKTDTIDQIERSKYVVVNGNIQDMQNPTETFATTSTELDTYQTEYRYTVGTINPFVANEENSDLPSEVVDTSGDVAGSAMQSATANSAANAKAESDAALDKMTDEVEKEKTNSNGAV